MNSKKNFYIPLYGDLPSIDLHGEDRKSAELLVKQFINDNIKIGNKKVVIIHGIGEGVLKKHVHSILRKDKRIEKFYINFFNVGCTIVEFKENI